MKTCGQKDNLIIMTNLPFCHNISILFNNSFIEIFYISVCMFSKLSVIYFWKGKVTFLYNFYFCVDIICQSWLWESVTLIEIFYIFVWTLSKLDIFNCVDVFKAGGCRFTVCVKGLGWTVKANVDQLYRVNIYYLIYTNVNNFFIY